MHRMDGERFEYFSSFEEVSKSSTSHFNRFGPPKPWFRIHKLSLCSNKTIDANTNPGRSHVIPFGRRSTFRFYCPCTVSVSFSAASARGDKQLCQNKCRILNSREIVSDSRRPLCLATNTKCIPRNNVNSAKCMRTASSDTKINILVNGEVAMRQRSEHSTSQGPCSRALATRDKQ